MLQIVFFFVWRGDFSISFRNIKSASLVLCFGSHTGIRNSLNVLPEGLWPWEALPVIALGILWDAKGQHFTKVCNTFPNRNICTGSPRIHIFKEVTEQLVSCALN